jgi:hypothetical protein
MAVRFGVFRGFYDQPFVECAVAGVSVIRALTAVDAKISHMQLARAIGLLDDDEQWQALHGSQVSAVLNLIAAVDEFTGSPRTDFKRVINARTGEPGMGVENEVRIVVSQP